MEKKAIWSSSTWGPVKVTVIGPASELGDDYPRRYRITIANGEEYVAREDYLIWIDGATVETLFREYLDAYDLYTSYNDSVTDQDPDHAAKATYFLGCVDQARARYEAAGGVCTLEEVMNRLPEAELDE